MRNELFNKSEDEKLFPVDRDSEIESFIEKWDSKLDLYSVDLLWDEEAAFSDTDKYSKVDNDLNWEHSMLDLLIVSEDDLDRKFSSIDLLEDIELSLKDLENETVSKFDNDIVCDFSTKEVLFKS